MASCSQGFNLEYRSQSKTGFAARALRGCLAVLRSTAQNTTLGQSAVVGNFVLASGGAGYSGNSYGFIVGSSGLAYNDTSGNYDFTLTASVLEEYGFTGEAVVNIHVVEAQLQMFESDGTTILSHAAAVTTGGWVLENNNDYNYQLTSANGLIPADQQTGGVNVNGQGDPALLKLGINSKVSNAAAGHFVFQLSSDLNLWQNADRTGEYTGSNVISAVGSQTPWYVEGTAVSGSQGADSVTLDYVAPNGAAVLKLDQVKYSVYAIGGAENVPGYGQYTYSVTLPSGVAANGGDWNTPNPADVPIAQPSQSDIAVAWSQGPEIGVVQYTPAPGFSGQWNVNVVQVQVSAGTVTEPAGKAVPNGANFLAGSFYEDTAPAAIVFTNTVTVHGAGSAGNWGLAQLNIGYMQEDTIVTEDGTYANGATLHSNLDGQTYTDWATYPNGANPGPWTDATLTPSSPGEVAGVPGCVAYFQPQSNGQQVTLKHADNPILAVPASISGVASVTVTNGGTGYTSAPTVVFSGGTAAGSSTPIVLPTATATISNGKVTSITMVTNGSGYATAPTVSLLGGGGTGASGAANLGTWDLTSTNLKDTFVRYVAAQTDDTANGANHLYYAMMYADWQTNYQATVQNRVFTPTAAQAITGDTSFTSAVSQGAAPSVLVTSTPANTAAGSETWRQAVSDLQNVASAGVNGGSPSATGTQSTPSFGAPFAFGVPVSGRPLVSSRFGLVGTSSTLTDWPQAWASNSSNGGVLWTFSGDWTLEGWLW